MKAAGPFGEVSVPVIWLPLTVPLTLTFKVCASVTVVSKRKPSGPTVPPVIWDVPNSLDIEPDSVAPCCFRVSVAGMVRGPAVNSTLYVPEMSEGVAVASDAGGGFGPPRDAARAGRACPRRARAASP